MKLLVTGGAGFIGSNFIKYMLEKYPEYSIVCLDSLSYAGNLSNLSGVTNSHNFSFVKGDIADVNTVYNLFQNSHFDVVVNFAAESHVDRSISDPYPFIRSNVLGTQTLLDACVKFGVPRFHQISTDEVYGDLPLDDPSLTFSESSPLKPSSPYSASKAAADLLALAYFRTYGLYVTISRSSNNYGPFQHSEKLIPHMLTCAFNDKPLPVYGNGQNVRDWIFVLDHCSAVDTIIHKGEPGNVYNVGANNAMSNLEIVKLILDKLNKPHSLITFVPDRLGHDLRYALDCSKLTKNLGWSPAFSFPVGFEITLKFFIENNLASASC